MTLSAKGALVIAAIVVWVVVLHRGPGDGWALVGNVVGGVLVIGFVAGFLVDAFGGGDKSRRHAPSVNIARPPEKAASASPILTPRFAPHTKADAWRAGYEDGLNGRDPNEARSHDEPYRRGYVDGAARAKQ